MTKTFSAEPTKEFFINMLVRDINLQDAIGDLVDNCIDGANRLKSGGSFEGLYINITLNADNFVIEDNCGGIDIEIAKKYAFRFGRPDDVEDIKYSIGQFGIGMKRALFKLGNQFSIDTKTIKNSFKMSVDVNKWRSEKDKWVFEYDHDHDYSDNQIDTSKTGTKITVTELNEDVKTAFVDDLFLQNLQNDLELNQLYNLNKGLKITFNGNLIKAKNLKVNVSPDFKLGHWESKINGVSVKLLVGVGSQQQELGGWYIFCNNRLIVGPDTSELTGWTGKGKGGVASYHHQYYRFRGYAFFEAEDSEKLPWNTTKTGMNPDSPIFKAVRLEMIEMMKSVVNSFLNPLKKENESDFEGERVLNEKLEKTHSINITSKDLEKFYAPDRSFLHPTPVGSTKKVSEGKTKILFEADKALVNKMKLLFGVKTAQEVGIKAFEYVVKNEIE
jgi:hypothetical protein